MPQCYFSKGFSPVIKEIHRFSDASERAYAAVLYVRIVSHNGTVITRLIASKTQVSPVKKQSVPQFELLGALIPTRFVNTVLMHCPQKMKVTCWVDSTSTLFWINNDHPWKQYVSCRVSEIRMSPSINQWRYCPGTVNPPSRGLDARQLSNCALWWEGPPFLKLCEDDRPRLTEIEPCGSTLAELTKNITF